MRVVFVENSGSIVGGGQFSVLGLAGELRKKGWEILFILPEKGTFYDLLVENGFSPAIENIGRFNGARFWRLPFAAVRLRKRIKLFKPQIVHTNSSRATLAAGLALPGTSIPLIWHLRAPGREPLYDFFLSCLCDRILAVSEFVAKRIPLARKKISIVPNGVSAPGVWLSGLEKEKMRAELGIGKNPVVGTVSQLIPLKGIDFFLKAAKEAAEKSPETVFLVVGGPVEEFPEYGESLKILSGNLGISDRVRFVGFKKDVYIYYQIMDIFCLFSRGETFGRSIVEAGMCSLPVVAAKDGGIPETVEDGETGILVEPDNMAKAAETIIFLLRNPAIREQMGQSGRERAWSRFTAEKNAENVLKVYEVVMKQ